MILNKPHTYIALISNSMLDLTIPVVPMATYFLSGDIDTADIFLKFFDS